MEHARVRQAGPLGDVRDGRPAIAVRGERLPRGGDDLLAALASLGV
jgi:hypothetical protein